jgi:hypothetical protein
VAALAQDFRRTPHFGPALDLQGMWNAQMAPLLAVAATHKRANEQQLNDIRSPKSGISQHGRIAKTDNSR